MKLIAEYTEDAIEYLTEQTKEGKKYFIEGIFAQANTKNKNGRIYEQSILAKAVDKYVTEQVNQDRAVGELNHPDGPTIDYKEVSHKITELKWDGDNVIGKASILDTPNGRIVKGLIEGNVRVGVSTRGMGSLETRNGVNYVRDDFILNTVDIVQDPSAHQAFVNAVNEGVEWEWSNGILRAKTVSEENETEFEGSHTGSYEEQVVEFKNFLSKLKQNF